MQQTVVMLKLVDIANTLLEHTLLVYAPGACSPPRLRFDTLEATDLEKLNSNYGTFDAAWNNVSESAIDEWRMRATKRGHTLSVTVNNVLSSVNNISNCLKLE